MKLTLVRGNHSFSGVLGTFLLVCLVMASFPVDGFSQFREGIPYRDPNLSDRSLSLKEHISFISSAQMEGRRAGSEGERLTAEYIYSALEGMGVEMLTSSPGDPFGIRREEGDTLRSLNVVGVVQGHDKSMYERFIVIGARMDNLGTHTLTVDGTPVQQVFSGAVGNASGLAMMLELADMVSKNALLFRRSVVFVGFGSSLEAQAGSWYFLNRSFSAVDKIDAMINLDAIGSGDSFYAYTSSNQDLNNILGRLSTQLHPVTPQITAQEPFPSDHRAFYSKEIPSVLFTSGLYPEYGTPRDTESIVDYDSMERDIEYIYSFTRAIANVDDAPAFTPDKVKKNDISERLYAYYDCDEKPTFLGHADPKYFLQKWVYEYLRYPQGALEAGIQGQVQVRFVIDKDGSLVDAEIVKGVDPLLENEAIRVVEASPKWKCGKVKGVAVRSYMTIPIDFKLEKKGSRRRSNR